MSKKKFKVAYIDDDAGNVRIFKIFASEEFDVVAVSLKKKLSEIVDEVFDEKVDAVVIDYDLREGNSQIDYQGNDIFRKINEQVNNFPSFILTSKANKAEDHTIDVNAVYDRDVMKTGETETNSFLVRLKKQIENYHSYLNDLQEELKVLKKTKRKTLFQEERIIDLDGMIERSLSRGSQIPDSLKRTSDFKKLTELVDDTNKLISEIEIYGKKK